MSIEDEKEEFTGHVGSLSVEQKKVLQELKEKLSKDRVDIDLYTDEYLLLVYISF